MCRDTDTDADIQTQREKDNWLYNCGVVRGGGWPVQCVEAFGQAGN